MPLHFECESFIPDATLIKDGMNGNTFVFTVFIAPVSYFLPITATFVSIIQSETQ